MMFVSKTYSKTIGQMLIALLVLIVLSLFMSNINIMAHLGGFIGVFNHFNWLLFHTQS